MPVNKPTDAAGAPMVVNETVTRKTEKPAPTRSFGRLMGSAADVALRGVEVGATVAGGPLLGAAVRGVRVGAEAVAGGPLGGAGAVATGAAVEENSTMAQVQAMQQQAQEFNLQYLALQEQVQQENRRFTTVSNVLKAKHETAKGAIGNIRS